MPNYGLLSKAEAAAFADLYRRTELSLDGIADRMFELGYPLRDVAHYRHHCKAVGIHDPKRKVKRGQRRKR